MFAVSWVWGAGACCCDKYPFLRDAALLYIESVVGFMFTAYKGALPWLALFTIDLSSAGLATKSSSLLVSVVYF
jgi:hypothetical protein